MELKTFTAIEGELAVGGGEWSARRSYKEEKLGSYAVTCWELRQELYKTRMETS
jgi:hypothetical protein